MFRSSVRLTLFKARVAPKRLVRSLSLEDGALVLSLLLCLLGLHVSCLPGLECTEALLEPAPEHVELDRYYNDHTRRHELVVDVDVQRFSRSG